MNQESKIKNQVRPIIHNSLFVIQSSKGFTFIELILYIGIVTLILTAIIPFAWGVISNGAKSSVQQEVYSQTRYVSERIKYEIRNANDIISVSTSSINLNTPANPNTTIALSGGKISIQYGAEPPISINSDDTHVSDLTFTDYTSSDNKTKNVGFTLTVQYKQGVSRQEFKESVTLRGSAEVRSN